jgi:hypothetical protein
VPKHKERSRKSTVILIWQKGEIIMSDTDIQVSMEDIEHNYAMQVVNMVNIARQIRGGHAETLAKEIEDTLPNLLNHMLGFKETPLKAATLYAAGKLFKYSKKIIPDELARHIAIARKKQGEVLSDGCFEKLPICTGGFGCVPWATSLRPVDVTKPNPNGWRYIIGSHCGWSWVKPWGPGCGEPLGLYQCEPIDVVVEE